MDNLIYENQIVNSKIDELTLKIANLNNEVYELRSKVHYNQKSIQVFSRFKQEFYSYTNKNSKLFNKLPKQITDIETVKDELRDEYLNLNKKMEKNFCYYGDYVKISIFLGMSALFLIERLF